MLIVFTKRTLALTPTLLDHRDLPLLARCEHLFAIAAYLRRVERAVDLEDQLPAKDVRLQAADCFLGWLTAGFMQAPGLAQALGSPDQFSR